VNEDFTPGDDLPVPVPSPRQQRDFYQRLRARVRAWAERRGAQTSRLAGFVLAAPDLFHLLSRLTLDARVPAGEKAKLVLVLGYFISPFDLFPEALFGPLGYADDAALAALVLHGLIGRAGPEIVREHWAGEGDVLALIEQLLRTMDERLGQPLVRRLKRLVGQ
jgi:uncharacterized membrane protein YkvA (DUF1232 family)